MLLRITVAGLLFSIDGLIASMVLFTVVPQIRIDHGYAVAAISFLAILALCLTIHTVLMVKVLGYEGDETGGRPQTLKASSDKDLSKAVNELYKPKQKT